VVLFAIRHNQLARGWSMVRCRTAASADRGEPGKRRAPAGKARSCCPRRAATAVPGPPKRISKEVRTAIEGMLSGDCRRIGDAARKIGLALKTLSGPCRSPTSPSPCASRSCGRSPSPRRRHKGRITRQRLRTCPRSRLERRPGPCRRPARPQPDHFAQSRHPRRFPGLASFTWRTSNFGK
jgi:hypothetical protein